ncbi:MAG TPA: hypothetical protein VMM93_06435 [Vicinamibacterales bacterium]|nr:hypothetical protein [Vicinamibacterales bacterium]
MSPHPWLVVLLAAATVVVGGRLGAHDLSVVGLLDRYAAGQYGAVVAELSGDVDFEDLLEQLRRDGLSWIEAGGPAARDRRALVAATVALEAARAGAWREWKRTQRQPPMCADNGQCYQPPSVLYWEAPPLLIEWGCALLRQRETPSPAERWWQLAALAVAQRSEDIQFLVGDPHIGGVPGSAAIGNTVDEIKHLEHVRPRFPDEARFLLAEGIARERAWADDAVAAFSSLTDHVDVGGEATMRLGALLARQRRHGDALDLFEKTESLTRDPYVIFLARYFTAQIHERERRASRAEAAYRGAAAAVPHAQSATIALAALVFRDGRRAEAQDLVARMLAAEPPPADPWRTFVHADDRFWPYLIARLRQEILP